MSRSSFVTRRCRPIDRRRAPAEDLAGPGSCRQAVVDVDAVAADPERVQAVALGGEILFALLIRVRIPPVVRSFPCRDAAGGHSQAPPRHGRKRARRGISLIDVNLPLRRLSPIPSARMRQVGRARAHPSHRAGTKTCTLEPQPNGRNRLLCTSAKRR
ncbi:MAG: hypothetical protein K0S98_228 [Propionibacteriaceae bacterium]|nr:hypothetical protein [Propionibacteriaceae bacterium]